MSNDNVGVFCDSPAKFEAVGLIVEVEGVSMEVLVSI